MNINTGIVKQTIQKILNNKKNSQTLSELVLINKDRESGETVQLGASNMQAVILEPNKRTDLNPATTKTVNVVGDEYPATTKIKSEFKTQDEAAAEARYAADTLDQSHVRTFDNNILKALSGRLGNLDLHSELETTALTGTINLDYSNIIEKLNTFIKALAPTAKKYNAVFNRFSLIVSDSNLSAISNYLANNHEKNPLITYSLNSPTPFITIGQTKVVGFSEIKENSFFFVPAAKFIILQQFRIKGVIDHIEEGRKEYETDDTSIKHTRQYSLVNVAPDLVINGEFKGVAKTSTSTTNANQRRFTQLEAQLEAAKAAAAAAEAKAEAAEAAAEAAAAAAEAAAKNNFNDFDSSSSSSSEEIYNDSSSEKDSNALNIPPKPPRGRPPKSS